MPASSVAVTLDGDSALETSLHDRFYRSRAGGEWFEVTPDIEAFMAAAAAGMEEDK
jgi:hypothetical protein